jgi:hypothetical protein
VRDLVTDANSPEEVSEELAALDDDMLIVCCFVALCFVDDRDVE